MDTISIRIARPSDYGRIVAVLDDWWGRPISSGVPRLFLDHFWPTSRVAEAPSPDGPALAGFLIGFRSPADPDVGYVHFLGVAPEHRRGGLARALYAEFGEQARALGCRRLKAITSPVNTTSIRFHQANGFTVTASIPDYDGPGQDRVVFGKAL